LRPSLIRLVAAIGLVAAAFLAHRWWGSDERRVQRAFDGLLESVEKTGPETQLDRFASARDFAKRFANGFVVSAKPYEGTITDRQQLVAIIDTYRSASDRVRARGLDRELTLRDNGTADLYALVELDGSSAGGIGRERFRVRLSWLREEGEWRVLEAEILERLETSGIFD
jgi:hypothetical protein